MKEVNNKYVIRKRVGPIKAILHFIFFALMWLFVLGIIAINLCFIFGYYSDSMVSFYLLLNLNIGLYQKLFSALIIVIIITVIFGSYRFMHLRRHDQ